MEVQIGNWNLKVNPSKTDHQTLKRAKNKQDETWRTAKKLGTLLGDSEELTRRRRLASSALSRVNHLWKNKSFVREKKRIKIYSTCVKPFLTYNMENWALTQKESDKLDAFHRRQLRKVIGIHYPDKISNVELYARTGCSQLSHELFQARWRMFGHVLRMSNEVLAKQAVLYYFRNEKTIGFIGHPRTTIATVFDQDLKQIQKVSSTKRGRKKSTIASLPQQLSSIEDLHHLERLASERRKWQKITVDAHTLLKTTRSEN